MKNKLFILLLLISGTGFSQVPGYMGKRFSIGYSNYLSPSLIYPTANNTGDTELRLNTTHCLNAEYAIKKRTNFCFSVEFFKTGITNNSGFPNPNYTNYSSSRVYYHPSDKRPMQLRTTNISLGFKFFRPGFIAPVGKYQKLEFVLFSNKINYDKNAFTSENSSSNGILTAGSGEYEFKSFAIALTFGRQRVFYNSIILNTGFRIGASPNAVFNFILDDFASNGYNSGFENQIKQDMNNRIFTSQLFNFHIGIGFLAF